MKATRDLRWDPGSEDGTNGTTGEMRRGAVVYSMSAFIS